MSTEIITIGRDNVIDLQLTADDTAQDLSSVTKIEAIVGDTTVSNEDGTAWPIKWIGLDTTGEIRLKLGDEISSSYSGCMYIIVYDADNTDGIYWGSVKVRTVSI